MAFLKWIVGVSHDDPCIIPMYVSDPLGSPFEIEDRMSECRMLTSH